MKIVNKVINLLTVFVAFVASVSLLVGGIGVMNIMLVSVTERTREIGIRKALGAKTGSITLQFLAESAFITLIGGILGIVFGVLGAWMITRVIGMMVPGVSFSPVLSLKTILIASLFSSAVGIFFGIYPARKAAKLSPIEALRRE
jgi:putative ABC transport system permease protein